MPSPSRAGALLSEDDDVADDSDAADDGCRGDGESSMVISPARFLRQIGQVSCYTIQNNM